MANIIVSYIGGFLSWNWQTSFCIVFCHLNMANFMFHIGRFFFFLIFMAFFLFLFSYDFFNMGIFLLYIWCTFFSIVVAFLAFFSGSEWTVLGRPSKWHVAPLRSSWGFSQRTKHLFVPPSSRGTIVRSGLPPKLTFNSKWHVPPLRSIFGLC